MGQPKKRKSTTRSRPKKQVQSKSTSADPYLHHTGPAGGSIKQGLRTAIKHLGEDIKKPGKNSTPKGLDIDTKHVEEWKGFFTTKDVEDLWAENTEIQTAVESSATSSGERGVKALRGGMRNEMCLERAWATVVSEINAALCACASANVEQGTDTPEFVMIGDGGDATWISPYAEPNAAAKKPDYASYIFTHEGQFQSDQVQLNFNRMPGDAKVSRKFCSDMCPPYGKRFDPERKNVEATKVLKQIHGYMDSHEARYGYIFNNEEIIFLRRRDTGWSHFDVSRPIRHDKDINDENDPLNSKYALFYFHWKLLSSNDDLGWRLQSFGKTENDRIVAERNEEAAKKADKMLEQSQGVHWRKRLPKFIFWIVDYVKSGKS